MIAVVSGLFGLVIGSFLNVLIHRVPIRQSIVWPSSRCLSCGEHIKSFDNLPVVSYLMLRGRCRSCKARISPRYPLVEALTGMLFAPAAYEFGLSLSLVWALAGTNLEHRLLPNAIVVPATVVGLLLSAVIDPEGWWVYPLSAVAVAAGLFALAVAYPGGMGAVKMGVMLEAFLGPYAALVGFLGRCGRWDAYGYGRDRAQERAAVRGVSGAGRCCHAVPGTGRVGLVSAACQGGLGGARKV